LFAAGLCVAVSGCDEKLSDITGPTQNLTPTFSSIQNDIFANTDSSGRTQCVTCHTNQGRAAAGGLNLVGDGYNALVNRPSIASAGSILVIPGDPENSYLIKKLKGSAGIVGLRMPRNGPPFLTDGQITVIERWIQEGARNN
jgi:hypothetical protein